MTKGCVSGSRHLAVQNLENIQVHITGRTSKQNTVASQTKERILGIVILSTEIDYYSGRGPNHMD
jgi:hypothetical protein